jgi:hypothetical protein
MILIVSVEEWWQTFSSIISFLEASNSFFAGSSASAPFSASAFLASGSVAYHLDVEGRNDDWARERCDGRKCCLAKELRVADVTLELKARDCLRSVLGIIVGDVAVLCCVE